jgi:hypothetical protein
MFSFLLRHRRRSCLPPSIQSIKAKKWVTVQPKVKTTSIVPQPAWKLKSKTQPHLRRGII